MIKVIVSDLDGTLFGKEHKIVPETLQAVQEACASGIRFMVATGRDLNGTLRDLDREKIACDYILLNGAEVRDRNLRIIKRTAMTRDDCRTVIRILEKYPVSIIFTTEEGDYFLGTKEEMKKNITLGFQYPDIDMMKKSEKDSEVYEYICKKTKLISDIYELEQKGETVYKMGALSAEPELLKHIRKELEQIRQISTVSSFECNLEITNCDANKGKAVREYTESLGYKKDEIMVFGDSMNDYSMLSEDFAATVAMGNAAPEVRRVAKYVTRSNEDLGVAYAIKKLLEKNKCMED